MRNEMAQAAAQLVSRKVSRFFRPWRRLCARRLRWTAVIYALDRCEAEGGGGLSFKFTATGLLQSLTWTQQMILAKV